MPFAVLHIDLAELKAELGHTPKSFADALGPPISGLLVCDEDGTIFYLDEASRHDIAALPSRLLLTPR